MKAEKTPNQDPITRSPLPNSRKIYVPGKLHELRVAMREITLSDTVSRVIGGEKREANAPVTVYDTSGPYTDPEYAVDM